MTPCNTRNNQWCVIANATQELSEEDINAIMQRRVITLDGAYIKTQRLQIKTHVLLGDFDSIDASHLDLAGREGHVQVVSTPDQNRTDLEKALVFLKEDHAKDVIIFNAVSGRVDHSLYNLRLLKRFSSYFEDLVIHSYSERIRLIEDEEVELKGVVGARVSIMGFPDACVTSTGLRYDMFRQQMRCLSGDSVSNSLNTDSARLVVSGSVVLFSTMGIEVNTI